MLDFRIMIRFKKKENIEKINSSLKSNILFKVIPNEYMPIEIIYENFINTFNKEYNKFIYWNTEYNEFYQLLNEFQKHEIIEFNDFNM